MRPTEGRVSVSGIDGTAIQWPFCFPRYSTAALRLTVFADECRHQVVGRLPHIRFCRSIPAGLPNNVVPRARLSLRCPHEHQLVALAGDEIDRDVDLLLRRPLVAELVEHVVGARYPVVPYRHAQLACRIGAVHERRGNGSQRRGLQQRAPCQSSRWHRGLHWLEVRASCADSSVGAKKISGRSSTPAAAAIPAAPIRSPLAGMVSPRSRRDRGGRGPVR